MKREKKANPKTEYKKDILWFLFRSYKSFAFYKKESSKLHCISK